MTDFGEHSEPKLLRESQILALIPVSKSTFRRWVSSGEFPQGFKVSERIVVWRSEDVHNWISQAHNLMQVRR